MRYLPVFFVWLVALSQLAKADDMTIAEINRQVWQPFVQSYAESDGDLHASLYSQDIVRVSRGEVITGSAYIESMRRYVNGLHAQGGRIIQFRFNERSHSEDTAYESGVFRLMRSDGRAMYGAFTVVLKKTDGQWKLSFDRDERTDKAAWDSAQPMEPILTPVN